jgi:hypothetical protein
MANLGIVVEEFHKHKIVKMEQSAGNCFFMLKLGWLWIVPQKVY